LQIGSGKGSKGSSKSSKGSSISSSISSSKGSSKSSKGSSKGVPEPFSIVFYDFTTLFVDYLSTTGNPTDAQDVEASVNTCELLGEGLEIFYAVTNVDVLAYNCEFLSGDVSAPLTILYDLDFTLQGPDAALPTVEEAFDDIIDIFDGSFTVNGNTLVDVLKDSLDPTNPYFAVTGFELFI